MASGVLSYQVKCNTGFVLILKIEDKSAICSTPHSANVLIFRGVGEKITKQIVESMGGLAGKQPQNVTTPPTNPTPPQNVTTPPTNPTPIPIPTQTGKKFSVMTAIFGNNISGQISQLKPYLNSGDVIDLRPTQISYASELKSQLGVQVAIAGQTTINVDQLKSQAPTWSLDNVDIIAYDFEKATVPDFSTDQSTAISKFSQAYQIAHSLNKKLWINPAWQGGWQSDGTQWDWGEVAKNTDILCLQTPNLETGARQFGKNTHGMTLEQAVSSVVQQVKAKAPNTKVFFQFGAGTGQTTQQAIDDINKIKSLGIDGVFIFPQSGRTDFLVTVMQGIGKTS